MTLRPRRAGRAAAGRPSPPAADLIPVADRLRARVARGEFARLGPIELAGRLVVPSTELAARVVLAELDHLVALAGRGRRPPAPYRWKFLAEDLRRLEAAPGAHT